MQRYCFISIIALALSACGGTSSPWSDNGVAPSAVQALAGNAGDGAVSLGWNLPTGSAPFTYQITATPAPGSLQIAQSGTSALVRGLSNGTTYTLTIAPKNNAGTGPDASIQLQPSAPAGNNTTLAINGNNTGNDSSGIFDPSLLRLDNGDLWMAYSNVDYRGTPQINAVETSLAMSSDGGQTFTYIDTLGESTPAIVTDTSGTTLCGNATCNGYWVYEVPFLVDDSSDPDSARRFKLFAHKYFLYPPNTQNSSVYALGAIVMWTAPALDGDWSTERAVLGWNATPPELTANRNVNSIDPALSNCIAISEGSAATFKGALDFVFACSYLENSTPRQKIVQLRSTDHADSFRYVATLLSADDATAFDAEYFSAPALVATESAAPLLIVTPVMNRTLVVNGSNVALDAYSGCMALPLANQQSGELFRNGTTPRAILQMPALANRINGACSWERGVNAIGLLMSVGNPTAATMRFDIVNTAKNF